VINCSNLVSPIPMHNLDKILKILTFNTSDRKDIFELFEYNNIYEISLNEVIERGLLVPYTYIGLTDNVDYSKIRYHNQSYRVDDLEKFLIIPERNQAILAAYLDPEQGAGDKAIGFCVSIKHAERMADFFNKNGVKATAIHSQSQNRDDLITSFRNNDYQVVFTVDLFNEGVDFPNVRVLLFLRPTESKTVFLQQLGRGLRLCSGKDRVRILDFIGNYKRANQVRKYLAKSSSQEVKEENAKRVKKIIYEYSNGCEVKFDAQVEEILNQQDAQDLGIDKQDLKDAYFALAEKLHRKPTKQDLDEQGEYKSNLYIQHWETWLKFLQDVGEYTEASYHYPQGTHLGHILSILWYFGLPSQNNTHFDKRYIRMRGNLDKDPRVSAYQRQIKYKLQAAMELGILEDDRKIPNYENWKPALTPLGYKLRQVLEQVLRNHQEYLIFPMQDDGVPGTQMKKTELYYNQLIMNTIERNKEAKKIVLGLFLNVPAVQQMMAFLYHIVRTNQVEKQRIYQDFFSTPFVKRFCEQEGIEPASEEASKRRCPFLLNILNACGIIENNRSDIKIKKLMLIPNLVKSVQDEDETLTKTRYETVKAAWTNNANMLDNHDLSIVRELFGSDFLTQNYYLIDLDYIEV
ncbi:MAG: DEAD/DEAH box helicase, partial [Sphaerospermopsis kisseleviana]